MEDGEAEGDRIMRREMKRPVPSLREANWTEEKGIKKASKEVFQSIKLKDLASSN